MKKLMKRFSIDKGGIAVGVFFVLILAVAAFLSIADTKEKTYIYQGETTVVTLDAVKIVIPWEVEYTWWYFVPKDYKVSAEKELDHYCDFMIQEKFHGKYPLIDFLSSGGNVANVLPMGTKSTPLPILEIDTIYRNGIININEKDNKHLGIQFEQYIQKQLGIDSL